jgi:hypothetical protein
MTAAARILILVPHPDDEVVGCAVAARREALGGKHLIALYLTTGLPERELLWPWQRRRYRALVARIETTLVAQRIEELWTPAFEGGHQDYDATNLLLDKSCSLMSCTRIAAALRLALLRPAGSGVTHVAAAPRATIHGAQPPQSLAQS